MMHMGVIMSTVRVFSTVGGNLHYHHSNGPLGHHMEHHTCMGPTT